MQRKKLAALIAAIFGIVFELLIDGVSMVIKFKFPMWSGHNSTEHHDQHYASPNIVMSSFLFGLLVSFLPYVLVIVACCIKGKPALFWPYLIIWGVLLALKVITCVLAGATILVLLVIVLIGLMKGAMEAGLLGGITLMGAGVVAFVFVGTVINAVVYRIIWAGYKVTKEEQNKRRLGMFGHSQA